MAIGEIGPDDFKKVTEKAFGLWSGFVDLDFDNAAAALDRDKWWSFCVTLLEYVAQVCLTKGYAGGAQIVYSKNLYSAKRAPSWLLHAGNDVPYIVVDKAHILESIALSEFGKVVSRLVVHEVGHLALHWYTLKNEEKKWVTSADPYHELEAWLFCGTLIGLGLGLRAVARRQNGEIDGAWPCA